MAFGFSIFLIFFVFVDFLYSAVKLICHLCSSVLPQFLTHHLYPNWPGAESQVLQEEGGTTCWGCLPDCGGVR